MVLYNIVDTIFFINYYIASFSSNTVFIIDEIICFILNLIPIIGSCLFYIALVIFILSNKIKKTLNLANEHDLQKLHNISPKSALKILNESLESGTISEEEYNQQREIILNKI